MKNLIRKLLALATAILICAGVAHSYASAYEVVAKLPAEIPPGNIAISQNGRIFLTVHNFFPSELRLVELHKDGAITPFPNKRWAKSPTADNMPGIQNALGLNTDGSGRLWVLDNAGAAHSGRLLAFDLSRNAFDQVIYLAPPVTRDSSFLNDIAIDNKHNAIYISDTGAGQSPALIVVDLNTGMARRVLEGSRFTVAENIDMVIDGKTVTLANQPARIGVNPITIDNNFEWVYFAPMTGLSLYRVPTQALLDTSLPAQALLSKVERYGGKPVSDGIIVDNSGNVYITAIADAAIGVIKPNGKYERLFSDASLAWPDGFAAGADGYIYATINELHRSPVLNSGENAATGEFKIIRFKPLAGVTVGR